MREVPDRIHRLPDQYFTALLGRVAAAALGGGEPLVDLGRGNPEVGPPEHVVRALPRPRPQGSSRKPSNGRGARGHGSCTTSPTAISSSTAAALRASSPSTARGTSGSSSSACRR